MFMPGTTSRCISFMIINDSVVEERQESMIIRISSTQITVGTGSDIVFLTIEDDDSKWYISIGNSIMIKNCVMFDFIGLEIGFTQTQYSVLESVGSFELCTRIESGLIAPDLMEISLEIFLTAEGTAESIWSFMHA